MRRTRKTATGARTPGRAPVSPERIAASWRAALRVWGVDVTLAPPRPHEPWPAEAGARKKTATSTAEPLAYIDMETRQVRVNFALLDALGAGRGLTAVLAHEVGHHVRFPHTLALAARLRVLEQRLLPNLKSSLTNLFFDLQVNEVVGRQRHRALCAVYRAFAARDGDATSPLFAFYLAVYEELWAPTAGALVPAAVRARMDAKYPGWGAEARVFSQTFWALDDPYDQFVYFCSRVARYIEQPERLVFVVPLGHDVGEPGLGDWAGALDPDPRADRALREAAARGWIAKGAGVGPAAGGPFDAIDRACAGHGRGATPFRRALVDGHYRRLVERHLIEPPPTDAPEPDAVLPGPAEPWEPGDDAQAIDWFETILRSGPLAAASVWRRERLPDDPGPSPRGRFPAVEIYLDTSGSMPNPLNGFNAMTLAAQVLATSAIRRQGKVRAVLYSDGTPLVSDWMYDEHAARRFLLQFASGGTHFPFDRLTALADDAADVVRVVISDDGFLMDLTRPEGPPAVRHAVAHSRLFVAMLSLWGRDPAVLARTFKDVADQPAFRLVVVTSVADLAGAARDLARALFPAR